MKLEQGDAFEKTYACWLRDNLPHYEPFWSRFIGHDGNGHPMPIPGLCEDKEKCRQKLYQAHYSAAFGCFQIDEISVEINKGLGGVSDIKAFMTEFRNCFGMIGWIGHVRDMYKQMDEALSLKGAVFGQLQDFYCLRSHIMHGPRMPVLIEDGLIQIPRVAKMNKTISEWDDKSYWDDFDGSEFVYFIDFCTTTKNEFFDLVRSMHAKLNSHAFEFFEGKNIIDSVIPIEDFSQSSEFPALSAWIPPSGCGNYYHTAMGHSNFPSLSRTKNGYQRR